MLLLNSEKLIVNTHIIINTKKLTGFKIDVKVEIVGDQGDEGEKNTEPLLVNKIAKVINWIFLTRISFTDKETGSINTIGTNIKSRT